MTSLTTNSTDLPAVSFKDIIIISSVADLVRNTTLVSGTTRRLFPMKHYQLTESIAHNYEILQFGQNEFRCGTVLSEDYVYTGTGVAFANGYTSGTVASYADNGAGGTTVTLSGIRVSPKMSVTISGSTNYDGTYGVPTSDTTDPHNGDLSFDIAVPYVAEAGGATADIANLQFSLQNINVICPNGTLVDLLNQQVFFAVLSFLKAVSYGNVGARSFFIRKCPLGGISSQVSAETPGYTNGFVLKNFGIGNVFEATANNVVSDKGGTSTLFDFSSTPAPRFLKIVAQRQSMSLGATDTFIKATTESHKNLSDNGFAIIQDNSNTVVAPDFIMNVDKTAVRWTLRNNESTKNTKVSLLAHENNNVALTTVANGAFGAINVTALTENDISERWELTSATIGLLTYNGIEDWTGIMIVTLSVQKTGSLLPYRVYYSQNGLMPIWDVLGHSTFEIKTATQTVTFLAPISVSTGDTIALAIGGDGHTDSITITDLVLSIS